LLPAPMRMHSVKISVLGSDAFSTFPTRYRQVTDKSETC